MQKLLTLDPTQISSGLFSGVGKAAALLWAEGENISFLDMGVRRLAGPKVVQKAPGRVLGLEQAFVDSQRRIYYATDTELGIIRDLGQAFSQDALYTWPTAGGQVDLETWGSFILATNGRDPTVVWKNTGDVVALANTTFTWTKILFRHLAFVLAFNTSNGNSMVEWCGDDDIELWKPSGNNLAGNLTLRDLDSEIVAAVPLGADIAVYSRASMLIMSFIGGDAVYAVRPALVGLGAISRRSVVGQSVYNYGLTQNGVFKTDGSSFTYIDDPAMARWVKDTVDWDQSAEIWGYHDDINRCITWNFPTRIGARKSLSYHYNLQVFSRGDAQSSAGADRTIFETPLLMDAENNVCFAEGGKDELGFYIQTKPLDFGTRDTVKLLQLIRVDGQWSGNVRLALGTMDEPENAPDWFYDEALSARNFPDREGQYFVVKFYGTGRFYMTGLEFYGSAGGLGL